MLRSQHAVLGGNRAGAGYGRGRCDFYFLLVVCFSVLLVACAVYSGQLVCATKAADRMRTRLLLYL